LCRYPPVWNAGAAAWTSIGLTAVDGWFLVALLCGSVAVGVFARWPRGWMIAKPVLCGGAAVVWYLCGSAYYRPPSRLAADRGSASIQPVREIGPGNPVVWIILDEWDFDLTFRRDDRKKFPEFDR